MVESASGKHVKRIYLSPSAPATEPSRAVLRNGSDRIDGILLLDSLHTGYLPIESPWRQAARSRKRNSRAFVHFAERAATARSDMIITTPRFSRGTYAAPPRPPIPSFESLRPEANAGPAMGPNGMQQTSEVRAGRLLVMGFAGTHGSGSRTTSTRYPRYCRCWWTVSREPRFLPGYGEGDRTIEGKVLQRLRNRQTARR